MSMQAFSWTRGRAGRYAATALGAVALALGAFAPVAAQAAAPRTLYVSQGGLDSGSCPSASPCATVSYALTKAASSATIKVSGTINDHLTITSPVTITRWPGGPAGSRAVLDGTANGIVVSVKPGVTGVTLHDLTIENGTQGIYSPYGNSSLTLTDSTVSGNGNAPPSGSAIYNGGTMTIIDSTIAKNSNLQGGGRGGGILNGRTMTIIASTISGNTASGGGGIYSGLGATATLGATVVAGNTVVAGGTGGNCLAGDAASLGSAGYNLTSDKTGKNCGFTATTDRVSKNPLLGHLASNGGPTKTLLPAAGGPADDVILSKPPTTLRGIPVCPGTDQRGITRPAQGEAHCTIGAVEV